LVLQITLEPWHAVVLLFVHGLAGALWAPASQLYLYDVVGTEDLQSGVRLSATARNLGIMFGPAVGGGLLVAFGPATGLLINCFLYLPLIVWLFRSRYTGHLHSGGPIASANALSLADAWRTLREARHQPVILAMVVLAGATSFLVGNAFQAQMPQFGADIAGAQGEIGYAVLLTATAVGSVTAGFLLEWSSWLRRAAVRPAIVMGIVWGLAIVLFALTRSYLVAVLALFAAGVLQLGYGALAQTLVQLAAPPDRRGRVVGLFSMSQNGLRVGSGVTIGVLGSSIGIHASLAWSAVVTVAVCVALLLSVWRVGVATRST
jgi:MFS family permease